MIIRRHRTEEPLPMELLLDADPNPAKVRDYCANGCVWIGEWEGQTVAVCVVIPLSDDAEEITNIAVHPDFQRQGLGKKMLTWVEANALKTGIRWLEVGTADIGTEQIVFYKSFGFEENGIIPNFFVTNYPEPVVDNGRVCRDMVRFRKLLETNDS